MSDPSPQQRVPLGSAIPWTDEDLDKLAEVTDQDMLEAQAWVKTNADKADAPLWDAKPHEDAGTT